MRAGAGACPAPAEPPGRRQCAKPPVPILGTGGFDRAAVVFGRGIRGASGYLVLPEAAGAGGSMGNVQPMESAFRPHWMPDRSSYSFWAKGPISPP